jgi:hypothetical protein
MSPALGHRGSSGQAAASPDPTAATAAPAGRTATADEAGGPAPGPEAGPLARSAGPAVLLRRHWLVLALLAVGVVLRVAVQLAYRPALFYIDTTGYLQASQGNDPVAYRLPLRGLAQLINLDAVAALQHLLGLAMAVTIYLLLVRRGAARWLAALAVAPVLLDAYQLQAEQTLMPDVVFEALVVAGIAVLLWRPATTWVTVIAAGLILGAAAPVRQVGEILLLPALCYVLVVASGWRRAIGQAGALCAAFLIPILGYCTAAYLTAGHFSLSHTGATSTYGRMAAAADCATLRLPASERALCPTPGQRALGIDGLEHSPASPLHPYYLNKKLPPGEASRLVQDFSKRVLSQQPLRVLAAYGKDTVKLFAVERTTSPGDTPLSRWQFQTTFPRFPPHASRAVINSVSQRFGGGPPTVWRPVAGLLRAYQLNGGYTSGPLLAATVLLSLIGSLALLRRRFRLDLQRRDLALAGLVFLLTAAGVLLVSDLFEFSWRFQLPALVTLPPAAAAALAALVPTLRESTRGQPVS